MENNNCAELIDGFLGLSEAINISLNIMDLFNVSLPSNNYLKMHGAKTFRSKALQIFERRYRSE